MPETAPLFPQPIPIVGCTGEYASGKTLFLLTIDPKATRIYDLEKSSESYLALGFDRVDVPAELCRRYPGGYKPQQSYEWWRDHIRQIKPGQFRVIAIDPASEIESGLVEWVRNNPGHFGRTAAQYVRMQGLMWGDVKELWKSLLTDLASRCETFAFAVHMGDVWSGDKPQPGKRKPKGKSTLMELASLYLQLERKPDAKGNVPIKPSAIVLKSRLPHIRLGADGEDLIVPALPPRLPIATPPAIRQYMLHPPDYAHLRTEEQAPEQQMSEDDRASVRLATAEAERDAEQLRIERLQREQEGKQRAAAERQARAQSPQPSVSPPPPSPETPRRQTASFSAHAVTEEQLQKLSYLRADLFERTMAGTSDEAKREAWLAILAKRRVNTARALTHEQANELISAILAKLRAKALDEGMQGDRQPPQQEGGQADAASGG